MGDLAGVEPEHHHNVYKLRVRSHLQFASLSSDQNKTECSWFGLARLAFMMAFFTVETKMNKKEISSFLGDTT